MASDSQRTDSSECVGEPDAQCVWEWDGMEWQNIVDHCPQGTTCNEPLTPGTIIGQEAFQPCEAS